MFETFGRSYRLVMESFNVLRRDKEMMLFPVFSAVASILVLISFILPLLITGLGEGSIVVGILSYVIVFLYYLASYFVIIFFNVGLVYCAHIRLKGGDPTFKDGIKAALGNLDRILAWALVSATAGMILRAFCRRSGIIGRIIISLVGMAWTLLTFFVIPVMVIEKRGVWESISKSGSLFKKTWGENVIGQIHIGLIFLLLALLGLTLPAIGLMTGNTTLIISSAAAMSLYWVFLGIINSSLDGIFRTALYEYATTGAIPSGFSEDTIRNAYKIK